MVLKSDGPGIVHKPVQFMVRVRNLYEMVQLSIAVTGQPTENLILYCYGMEDKCIGTDKDTVTQLPSIVCPPKI